MSYVKHFKHADDIVNHLNAVIPTLTDPLLQAKYVGFVAVAAVTVYELAIKSVFIEFGTKKHRVFGTFTESYFDRINGKIRLPTIKDDYIKRFGERYKKRFEKKLERISEDYLRKNKRDIKSSYGNLITWRNDFAHEGRLRTTATYSEAVQSYEDGKEIIRCLAETMRS
ncbi:MAG: hypothetical protein HY788_21990 [Deltaproteobacteria bacterium]|nr:hypothetical protein [Deltaproteobacteria bacterium]